MCIPINSLYQWVVYHKSVSRWVCGGSQSRRLSGYLGIGTDLGDTFATGAGTLQGGHHELFLCLSRYCV